MNELCNTIESNQNELDKKLNQLEAESKILLYILEAINKKGVTN